MKEYVFPTIISILFCMILVGCREKDIDFELKNIKITKKLCLLIPLIILMYLKKLEQEVIMHWFTRIVETGASKYYFTIHLEGA